MKYVSIVVQSVLLSRLDISERMRLGCRHLCVRGQEKEGKKGKRAIELYVCVLAACPWFERMIDLIRFLPTPFVLMTLLTHKNAQLAREGSCVGCRMFCIIVG